MTEWFRARVLRLLRVPAEPHAPAGAPGSVKVFRAGKNFYRLRIAGWCWKQFWVFFGLCASITFLSIIRHEAEIAFRERRREAELERSAAANSAAATASTKQATAATPISPATAPTPTPASTAATPTAAAAPAKPTTAPAGKKPFTREEAREVIRKIPPLRTAEGFMMKSPPWVLILISLLEIAGVVFFVVQLPFSFAAVKLEYEQHWYIVTDRSLRIRTGLNVMLESTMSFANVQQVVVAQGPLQRLLGLADVRVQSAGGGSSHEKTPGKLRAESLHMGVFRGVDNADEIRDLILARLKRFREAGLGDPEDARAALGHANESTHGTTAVIAAADASAGFTAASVIDAETVAAARELLSEARALRAAAARA